jgi:hypothetical protein
VDITEFLFGFLLGWLVTLVATTLTVAGVRGALEPNSKKKDSN